MTAPFTLQDARAAGLTLNSLRGRSWRRLGTELYCWRGWREDRWQLLLAWTRLLPPHAVFGGATAAWLWGIEKAEAGPTEVILCPGSAVRERYGLLLRRCQVDTGEIAEVRGLRATTVHRTLRDLSSRRTPCEALVAIDAALHLRLTDRSALLRYTASVTGRPGAGKLRSLALLAEPAESPMETRLRWHLLQAKLPRPSAQVDLHDADGSFLGRADLCYPAERLVIEYDGVNHRERLAEDNRRQNLILNAGFSLLRFTASDLERPDFITAQVRQALRRARPVAAATRLASNPSIAAVESDRLTPKARAS